MPVYRYRYTGANLDDLSKRVPNGPTWTAVGPNVYVDITVAAPAKLDLDEYMATKGYTYESTDPLITPVQQSSGAIDHDLLTNFVGNKHLDHTGISISTSNGLQGGGNISTTRTISPVYGTGANQVCQGNDPRVVDAIHTNVAAEISTIAEKLVPVDADLVLIEDSQAANAKKRVQLSKLSTATFPHYQYIGSDTGPTTNLVAFNPPVTVIPVMQLTPTVTGLYRLQFNCEWQGSTAATVGGFALYVNNVQVPNSLRRSRVTAGGAWMNLMVEAAANVTAGQVVEVDWIVVAGGVLTVGNRFFSVLRTG